jgi:pilus assembly protein Flp/PilA
MNHLMAKLHTAWQIKKDEGATAVEYGLMVSLIAVAIIITVTALGGGLSDLFASITDDITP